MRTLFTDSFHQKQDNKRFVSQLLTKIIKQEYNYIIRHTQETIAWKSYECTAFNHLQSKLCLKMNNDRQRGICRNIMYIKKTRKHDYVGATNST